MKVSFKNEDGHVLVVFPDQRERNGMIGVLSRAEGHSTADAGYIRGLKAATAEQRVAGERLLRDAGYPAKPAKRNPLLANPRSHTISTAKGSFSSPDLHRVCAWQARHQGSFADIDGENVDDIDFDDEDLGACVRKVQARLKRAKRNPLLANPAAIRGEDRMSPAMARYWRMKARELENHVDVVDPWRADLAVLRKEYPKGTKVYRASTGGRWGKSAETRKLNPTYRAFLDSEASPRSVRATLEHAGYASVRVRTVKGTGKKKAPGAYALFVRKHMADFKGRMSAPEAMKAIGALWRSRGGVKSNPASKAVQAKYQALMSAGRFDDAARLYKRSHAAMKGARSRGGAKKS